MTLAHRLGKLEKLAKCGQDDDSDPEDDDCIHVIHGFDKDGKRVLTDDPDLGDKLCVTARMTGAELKRARAAGKYILDGPSITAMVYVHEERMKDENK